MILSIDDLHVESFTTSNMTSSDAGMCCTGCASGCGYFPTEGGCQSGDDANQL